MAENTVYHVIDPRSSSAACDDAPARSPRIPCVDTSVDDLSQEGTSVSESARYGAIDTPLSIFDGATGHASKIPHDTTLADVAEWVLTGRDPRSRVWRQPDLVPATVESNRLAAQPGALEPGTPAYQAYVKHKKSLPALMGQGRCVDGRRIVNLTQPSGLFPFDIDKLSADDVEREFERLSEFAEIRLMFRSPSRRGIKGYVLINPPPATGDLGNLQSHAIFDQVMAHLGILEIVSTDKSGKNSNRLCFLCHDPKWLWIPDGQAFLQVNLDSAPLTTRPRKPRSASPAGVALQGQAEDRDSARWDQVMATRTANGERPEPPDDFVKAALTYLASVKVGQDDDCCLAVGFCLKANMRPYEEWSEWLDLAGCGCSPEDRVTRWESFHPSIREQTYGAIVQEARRKGWPGTVPAIGKTKTQRRTRGKQGGASKDALGTRDKQGGASKDALGTRDKQGGASKDALGTRDKQGGASKDALGLVNALQQLGLEIRFNSRSLKSEVRPITEEGSAIVTTWGNAAQTQPNSWTILKPAQAANLRARIARTIDYLADNGQRYPLRFSREEWREANLDLSATTYVDPFEEWLESPCLPAWDNQDRWARIFTEGYGVIPGEHHTLEYLAHAGKMLVIPCVGRLYEPGVEASTMTVLIGKEGIGKSLGLKCLFPSEWRLRWFSDSITLKVSDQELLEKVAGFVLLEIGEMSGMMRVDQERVKTIISSCQDVARLAYREDSEAFPRRFHWSGSANDEGHGVLPDSSENRRFWPVNIPPHCTRGRVLQWFAAHYQQLWAQALVEWQAHGIEAWLNPEELEPERLDAAAAQRQASLGSPDLVDTIEVLDRTMLEKGNSMAELLQIVNAFGRWGRGDESAPLGLAEVAAKMASGPGAGIAKAVAKEFNRRGWTRAKGNKERGRAARGTGFWWPPADGQSQRAHVS